MTSEMNKELLRRLAEFDSGGNGVLSLYLDTRPQQSGERPEQLDALIIMRDRLREIERTLTQREQREAFQEDVARIDAFIETERDRASQGLAVFACGPHNLFETVDSGAPFETQIVYGPRPELYQLARLVDDLETAVVAVVDTNTARLFVIRTGFMKEIGGPDDKENSEYQKISAGGVSQASYRRHIQNNREEFARTAAEAIEQLVEREGATHLILAGNEVGVPLLKDALFKPMAELLHEETLRINIRALGDDVQREVEPILALLEAEQDQDIADRLVEGVRGGGLAVAGVKRTRKALEIGQVDTLVIVADAELNSEQRNELIQLAATTSAAVEIVEAHDALRALGGVGGILRYQT